MGEHHKPIKPNATVRFNTWLLASRVSESLDAACKNADSWAQWLIEADNEGHKQARLTILTRIVGEKQLNSGFSSEVLDMCKKVEEWIGADTFEQLAKPNQRYQA